jgi:hypothetical protein
VAAVDVAHNPSVAVDETAYLLRLRRLLDAEQTGAIYLATREVLGDGVGPTCWTSENGLGGVVGCGQDTSTGDGRRRCATGRV